MRFEIHLPEEYEEEFLTKSKDYSIRNTEVNLEDNIEKNFEPIRLEILNLKRNGYKKMLVVGQSTYTSSIAIYKGLQSLNKRNFEIINTYEPKFIKDIKKKYGKDNTLVVFICESGKSDLNLKCSNIFEEYKKIIISKKDSPLEKLKTKEDFFYEIPKIPGLFCSPTLITFLSIYFLHLNIVKIKSSYKTVYKLNRSKKKSSEALDLAKILFFLEKKGYDNIYFPIYSKYLDNFKIYLTQLFNQTTIRNLRGLDFLAGNFLENPTYMDRFLFGKRNTIGFFVTTDKEEELLETFKSSNEKNIGNLKQGIQKQYLDFYQEAKENNLPVIKIVLEDIKSLEISYFLGFLNYLGLYNALLRDINIFNK